MTVPKGWAVNTEAWQAAFHTTQDCTWKRVGLHSDNRQQVPTTPGVYVMCVKPWGQHVSSILFDHLTNAIYVGQATNLRARFNQHVRGDRPGLRHAIETFRTITFYFAAVECDRLSLVEQSLIDALGPSVNAMNVTRVKNGETIRVQLNDPVPLRRV